MKKEWTEPKIVDMDVNGTQNSNQEEGVPDGVRLEWLDRDGVECTVCS